MTNLAILEIALSCSDAKKRLNYLINLFFIDLNA